jgi:hypothetical protein
MNIGQPKKIITIEPIEEPKWIPAEEPAIAPAQPIREPVPA